ncbi:MAG: hypothetical protein A2Y97_04620 [Nitrospirae bacterium RBG_13_39_12]|nr:MAG: hypothetical protein A2Y97_04620 [Nitrospirae bacterium RBG_13_39_12]
MGTILLSTILKEKGYNSKAFIEDISEPDWKMLKEADIIGISSITSTAQRAFQLARKFHSMNIPIIIGGPHATFIPEESLKYADYVVRGEGEETIVELIEHLEAGKPLNDIKGLSYKDVDAFVHNPPRPLIDDLDAAPIPDLNVVHNWRKKTVIPIATSRGCPFGCKFCSVIQMFGRKYRFKSIERVMEEIKKVASRKAHIFFVDDNFAANKERTKTLLKRIIAEKIKIEWSAQVRTDIVKDKELIELMSKSGCFTVFVGFESINPLTLHLYNKHQKVDDIVDCIKIFKNASIGIHGMFVFGGDTDDIETIRSTQRFARRLGIDSVQFLMLTPLPGTPVFDDLMKQGRLIHTDWAKYDAHHAVFEPRLMTAFELHTETFRAMADFYSWGKILKNLMRGRLFYSFIGLYGKRSLHKLKTPSKKYLKDLKNLISTKFDKRTGKLGEYFLNKKKAVKKIVLSSIPEGGIESKFFKTFFEKIGKRLIISREESNFSGGSLTIMPILQDPRSDEKPDKKLLTEVYEKYKTRFQNLKIIPLEAGSLYRLCVDLGLLMGIKMKKIRRAYEKAVGGINGKAFNCHAVLIIFKL